MRGVSNVTLRQHVLGRKTFKVYSITYKEGRDTNYFTDIYHFVELAGDQVPNLKQMELQLIQSKAEIENPPIIVEAFTF